MIKAVLWDFGGVLTSSPFEAFARYEHEKGLPKNFLRSINATNPDANAWARFERNDIDLEAFDKAFEDETTAAGHPVPGREIIALLAGNVRPEMVAALKRCAANFKTACITNNVNAGEGAGMARSLEQAQEVEQILALFDEVIESSKAGVRKPDPKIYQMACEVLQIDPTEAVYLDDLGINLKPAKAMGMQTIKVSDPAVALEELEAVTGLSLKDRGA